ncbi:LamG-like jellyroll fold domain-containing protein [Nitrosospira sp. NpAV]|uniref:LamG-like jellyroll fold domain-containing protein n=1 Tax=Nitrosospira sp. NpAV TaxID=58133 RepID=UPI0005A2E4C8|nr:LamG-like jellyroll fold domain-containing protein [Nitrosospira sp. NpAV]KIO49602.1 hypothetical protein SQ11_05630 [Nitrosospira sp. NpAV]
MAIGFGAKGVGSTDKVTGPTEGIPAQFSFHIWTNRNGEGAGNLGRIFGREGANPFVLCNHNDVTSYRLFIGAGAATNWLWNRPAEGVWAPLGFSIDTSSSANDPTVYQDGVRLTVGAGLTQSGSDSSWPVGSDTWYFGNNPGGTRNWNGSLAEVAWWNTILTDAEFYALQKGVSAEQVRPESLVRYLAMVRVADEKGLGVTGTASLLPHPDIRRTPQVRRIWATTAGGAAALAGDAQAAAVASGALTTQIEITGTALSVAAAIGTLTTQINLASDAVSVSTASGTLTARIQLSGAALAQAISSAALSGGINLSAAAVAEAAASGMLDTVIRLIGSAVGTASASGNLSTGASGELEGNAQASATASASLTAQIRLNAAAVAQAAASASLVSGIRLKGDAQGGASANGELSASITLAASAISQAIVSGSLTTHIQLDGPAIAQAIAIATLHTGINLAGSAASSASAYGDLSIGTEYSAGLLTTRHALAGSILHTVGRPITQLTTEVGYACSG